MSNTIALIVDDSSIRQVVNAALSEAGYAVLEMDARALDRPGATSNIDAICLGIDDVARLQQLRALDAQLPIIVLTSDENAERALREGAYDVVARPVSVQRLRHAVARAVERRTLAVRVIDLSNRLAQYETVDVVPMRDLERAAIERALHATRGSVTKAAKLLGIGRATLYRRLASPDMADIRARRITQPGSSAFSQAAMARQP